MKNRFEVSTEGMRSLQLGREPWQLAKELISNAWDEKTTICRVTLKSLTTRTASLSIYDDGEGFTNIADAWTLMGHTPKRQNPTARESEFTPGINKGGINRNGHHKNNQAG